MRPNDRRVDFEKRFAILPPNGGSVAPDGAHYRRECSGHSGAVSLEHRANVLLPVVITALNGESCRVRGRERGSLIIGVMFGALAVPRIAGAAAALNLNPELWITAMNVIIFVALIYPTNRFLLQPILKVLRERIEAVEGTAGRASAIREEAAAHRSDLEERLAEARAEAQSRRVRIQAETEAEERTLIDAARRAATVSVAELRETLAGELESARSALEADARGLAEEAAAKILGRAL